MRVARGENLRPIGDDQYFSNFLKQCSPLENILKADSSRDHQNLYSLSIILGNCVSAQSVIFALRKKSFCNQSKAFLYDLGCSIRFYPMRNLRQRESIVYVLLIFLFGTRRMILKKLIVRIIQFDGNLFCFTRSQIRSRIK